MIVVGTDDHVLICRARKDTDDIEYIARHLLYVCLQIDAQAFRKSERLRLQGAIDLFLRGLELRSGGGEPFFHMFA